MYNKLFTKILDSSVWLETTPTRIVWITFLASMDQDGFVELASPQNVAHRARIDLQEATEALKVLESPDTISPGQDHDGRRIERVPGGWMVLNASKYKEFVSRQESLRLNRERVARHRAKSRKAVVTPCNDLLMQSETETETEKNSPASQEGNGVDSRHNPVREHFKKLWLFKNKGAPTAPWSGRDAGALAKVLKDNPKWSAAFIIRCLDNWGSSETNHAENAFRILPVINRYASSPLDKFSKPTKTVQDEFAGFNQ